MTRLAMLAVCTAALAVSCSDSHPKNHQGGETHFLKSCIDNACGNGLECVCGVCTKACEDDDACGGLDGEATCNAADADSLLCDDRGPEAKICDAGCSRDAQCSSLGDGYQCFKGRCRPEAVASAIENRGECTETGCEGDPLVMIVLDTSGSMERTAGCTCTTAMCTECLPNCNEAEKNRWAQALEALTGTFDDFSCEARARNEVGTYDVDYELPYHEPNGTQRSDGVIDAFAARVRFGLATFDGIQSYGIDEQLGIDELSFSRAAGQDGLWSYPPLANASELEVRPDGYQTGVYRYAGCPHDYVMNTGIRSRDAESGALTLAVRSGASESAVQAIRHTLLATRPYGGTPIAAALDDVRWLFERDPLLDDERKYPDRKHHLILITDGRADDDYRNVGCDCFDDGDADGCNLAALEAPAQMHCPYPSVTEAARQLRCGVSEECGDGAFDSVHFIGLSVADDEVAVETINEMAAASGGTAALVDDGEELRGQLASLLDAIVDGSYADDVGVPGPSELSFDRGLCTVGDLQYENGARWQNGCNVNECHGGEVTTTMAACDTCRDNSHCSDGNVCYLGVGCVNGWCGPPTPTECAAPVNTATVCTCDRLTLARTDCSALIHGIDHAGECE